MSRKRRKKKQSKRSSGRKKYSTLGQHKRHGKNLVPPFLQIPNLQLNSWMNERLPGMLWAILLIRHLPRDYALSIFRKVAKYINDAPENEISGDVTHTGLQRTIPKHQEEILNILTSTQELKDILAHLLLFDKLPGKDIWEKALKTNTPPDDWIPLMSAVATVLDPHSQEATDCRWLKVICMMMADRLKLPAKDLIEEIAFYPNQGDMRKVRPMLRSTEGTLSGIEQIDTDWVNSFWDQCLKDTPCFPLQAQIFDSQIKAITNVEHVKKIYENLAEHLNKVRITSAIDPKHDTVFGMALFCLSLLLELLRMGNANSILGRLGLRTILECYITITYLVKKDDLELWNSYRVFGSGQAKLSFLKLHELPDQPSYVDLATLEELANEDVWQEFVQINIGHWEKSNLRKISEDAGVKDKYDKYYSWTSTFIHGHWGAVRDSVFDICGNPLHRVHRIPRDSVRNLPDVIPDACELVDEILGILSESYQEFKERVTVVTQTS